MSLYRGSLLLGTSQRPVPTLLIPPGLGDPTATSYLTLRITGTLKPPHHGRLETPLKKKLVKVNIWSRDLCGAEAWSLRKVDQ